MRKMIWVVLIVAVGVALSFYYAKQETPAPSLPVVAEAPAPQPAPEPAIRYPVEPQPPGDALPPLNGSDPAVSEALAGLWGQRALDQLFNVSGFVRRIVATVDNLPREKVNLRLMPLKPAAGSFRTVRTGEGLAISRDNAARYWPYMHLVTSVDSSRLVALYVRFYPLFQQAYEDLGYPNGYFNDRLIEVIDHLLATPSVPAQPKLVQPKVFYEFADPALESRSAGQKILMRIGEENAARVKVKLREIRSELARGATPQ